MAIGREIEKEINLKVELFTFSSLCLPLVDLFLITVEMLPDSFSFFESGFLPRPLFFSSFLQYSRSVA